MHRSSDSIFLYLIVHCCSFTILDQLFGYVSVLVCQGTGFSSLFFQQIPLVLNWILEKWVQAKIFTRALAHLPHISLYCKRTRTLILYHTMHEMIRTEMAQLNPCATLYSLRMKRARVRMVSDVLLGSHCVYGNKRCEMDGNATHIHCMHKTAICAILCVCKKHFQPCTVHKFIDGGGGVCQRLCMCLCKGKAQCFER